MPILDLDPNQGPIAWSRRNGRGRASEPTGSQPVESVIASCVAPSLVWSSLVHAGGALDASLVRPSSDRPTSLPSTDSKIQKGCGRFLHYDRCSLSRESYRMVQALIVLR